MTIALLWLQLIAAAAIILFSSNYLAKSADVIALKTGLGRSFIGVVLLATATSLPELGTGVSSIVLFDEPDLAAGDAFGSNIFNLLIIGLLDLFWRDGPILNRVGTTSIVVAALGIVMISLAAVAIFIHAPGSTSDAFFSGWYVSPVSIVIILAFLGSMYLVYVVGRNGGGTEDGDEGNRYESEKLSKSVILYLISALVIVVTAIWLARSGDGLARAMGWDASFVGTQFLAFSTSLPELAASFAAIRINAPELAITNVLGSNLFNMGFVLFLDDAALVGSPLWSVVSPIHTLTAIAAILMTAVVMISLAMHSRNRPSRFWTGEAVTLIGLYIVVSVLVFKLG